MALITTNLPGMLTEFQDGGLQLREQQVAADTGSLLILGTATDGPVMEPVAVDASTVEAVFGKSVYQNGRPNGATLPEAFAQAYATGCRDIRLMRISGSPATSTVQGASVTETIRKIERPVFGAVGGNDEVTFTLGNENVIIGSVAVIGGGRTLLNTTFTAAEEGKKVKVTLKPNSVNAGTDIAIRYSYYPEEAAEDEFVAEEEQTTFELTHTPIDGGIVSVTLNGIQIEENDYTLNGKNVNVPNAQAGDEVKVSYIYLSAEEITVTENSDANGQWIAGAEAMQEFSLTKRPVVDTFKLYVDGREIIPSAAWTLDYSGEFVKLKLDKSYFTMGSTVEGSFYYEESTSYTPEIRLESYFGGMIYNETQREVVNIVAENGDILGKKLIITKPVSKRSAADEAPREYSSLDYPTFGQLVEAINNDYNNGVVRAETDYPDAETKDLLVSAKISFTGGDDGLVLTKEEMYKLLAGERNAEGLLVKYGAFQMLENYKVDYVVVKGVYADDELVDKHANFAYELAAYCAVASQTHMTHGVIALRPPLRTGLANIEEHVKNLEAFQNDFYLKGTDGAILTDREGNPFDIGRYITIVAGPQLTFTSQRLGTYNDDGDVVYAAMNTVLAPSSSPTNKKVANARGLRFTYSQKQLQRLLNKRFVTFQYRTLDNAVSVTDGVTCAQPGSDYSRIVNIKVVRACLEDIFVAANPFIGEPPTAVNNNALISAIAKKLDLRMESGDIADYDFQLVSNPLDKLIGDSKLELAIVPPGERRRITVVTGLKKSL